MNIKEYKLKQIEKQMNLMDKVPKTPIEKAINDLEYMVCNINPYSRAWRWGHIKSLKLAIKALKRQQGCR